MHCAPQVFGPVGLARRNEARAALRASVAGDTMLHPRPWPMGPQWNIAGGRVARRGPHRSHLPPPAPSILCHMGPHRARSTRRFSAPRHCCRFWVLLRPEPTLCGVAVAGGSLGLPAAPPAAPPQPMGRHGLRRSLRAPAPLPAAPPAPSLQPKGLRRSLRAPAALPARPPSPSLQTMGCQCWPTSRRRWSSCWVR
jgi:hypothetical protein